MRITIEYTPEGLRELQLAVATRQIASMIAPDRDAVDLLITAVAAVAYVGKDASIKLDTCAKFAERLAAAKEG